MTREEVEDCIFHLAVAIKDICHAYCPEDGYFSLGIVDDTIMFNNAHWEHEGQAIDCRREVE